MNKLRIVSTLADAATAFARGRPNSGIMLAGAAALSTLIPGLGTVVPLSLRLVRRFRQPGIRWVRLVIRYLLFGAR